jgi:hypothetical protein
MRQSLALTTPPRHTRTAIVNTQTTSVLPRLDLSSTAAACDVICTSYQCAVWQELEHTTAMQLTSTTANHSQRKRCCPATTSRTQHSATRGHACTSTTSTHRARERVPSASFGILVSIVDACPSSYHFSPRWLKELRLHDCIPHHVQGRVVLQRAMRGHNNDGNSVPCALCLVLLCPVRQDLHW